MPYASEMNSARLARSLRRRRRGGRTAAAARRRRGSPPPTGTRPSRRRSSASAGASGSTPRTSSSRPMCAERREAGLPYRAASTNSAFAQRRVLVERRRPRRRLLRRLALRLGGGRRRRRRLGLGDLRLLRGRSLLGGEALHGRHEEAEREERARRGTPPDFALEIASASQPPRCSTPPRSAPSRPKIRAQAAGAPPTSVFTDTQLRAGTGPTRRVRHKIAVWATIAQPTTASSSGCPRSPTCRTSRRSSASASSARRIRRQQGGGRRRRPDYGRRAGDALGLLTMPLPPLGGEPAARARWRVAYKGLHWRVGGRLHALSLASSLETSLLLVAREASSRRTVGCASPLRRPAAACPASSRCRRSSWTRRRRPRRRVRLEPLRRARLRRRLGTRLLHTCEWVVASEWARPAVHLHVDMANDAAPPTRAPATSRSRSTTPPARRSCARLRRRPRLRARAVGRGAADAQPLPPRSLSLGAEILRERTAAAIT